MHAITTSLAPIAEIATSDDLFFYQKKAAQGLLFHKQ